MGLQRYSSARPSGALLGSELARAGAAFLALLALGAGSAAQGPLFTFVQTSDSQPDGESEWRGFEDVLEVIADAGSPGALLPRPVDLVLFPGDITEDNGNTEWVRCKGLFDTWLTSNDIPLMCVPGNRDQGESASQTQLYEQYIGSSAVWDRGSASFTGQNGKSRNTGWTGLRFIGFNNSNGAWNKISASDTTLIQSRVSAAAAANENIFLVAHHPHNGQSRIPLAAVLTQPAIVGYVRGHSGDPEASRGLSGVSNPNVWDLNTNAIVDDRDLIYYEVFQDEIKAYVIVLNDSPTSLPPANRIPLVFSLRSGGGGPLPPVADFSGTPRSGAAPLLVRFSDLSSGGPTSWLWTFGDGATSTAASPDHVYTSAGTFSVSLRASNGAGSNTRTRAGYVTVGGSTPVVTLTSVADSTTNEQNKNGNTGTVSTIRVKSGTGKAFRAYLKFDLSGISGTVTSARLRLYVTDPSDNGGSLYPVSSSWTETGITWNNQPSLPGSSIASLGAVSKNTWKEIDVTSAVSGGGFVSFALAGGSPNVVYYSSREGTNKPQLVLDVQSTALVPEADFIATVPPSGPQVVQFTDTSSGTPTAWQWSFGDGEGSTEANPRHAYAQPGLYTVSLTTSNALGSNTRTRADFLRVVAPASAQLFEPIADAHVDEVNAGASHGLARAMQADAQPGSACQSFLKFDLADLTGHPTSARLRLFVTDESDGGGSIYLVSNHWAEDALHWTNKPTLPLLPLATAGDAPGGAWLEFDVSAAIHGPGVVSFGHAGATTNSLLYSSREGWQPPQLVVETGNLVELAYPHESAPSAR